MDWADFLHADCDAIIFIRPTLHFLFLAFKCQSSAVVLTSPLVVAGMILWDRVCPSLPPDISACFLEIWSLDFCFCQGARNLYEVVHDDLIFLKNSKIDCISKLNRWNNLIFLHSSTNVGRLKVGSMIFERACQKWQWLFSSWDPKTYLKNRL